MDIDKVVGLHKSELDTPCLVIDKDLLIANLKYMVELTTTKQVGLRPHAKTHKSSIIAHLQLELGAIGICVTKVSEAMVMAKAGIKGLLITSPVVGRYKIERLIELLRLAPDTLVVIDNLENAYQLSELLKKNDLRMSVLIDVDGGIGRTGVSFGRAVDFALALNKLPNLDIIGIQCYAGHIQHIPDLVKRRKASHEILLRAAKLKLQLQELGINCKIQTGSGTGTFSIDSEIDVVTEVQPGSYCVMDQEYNNISYKERPFNNAMTMLTKVISVNQQTHVTVDAGTKALYKVATKPQIISHSGLAYDWDYFGDEHGKVTVSSGSRLPQLGEVLELVVAHCDPTINLFDNFYITQKDIVVDRWAIDLRGCCQ